MSKWFYPITDRTATDIVNRTSKAFLNVADWLRIYGNTEQAQALAQVMLATAVTLTDLSAPAITSFPAAAEINTLIENIDLIRQAIAAPTSIGIVALDHDYEAGSGATVPTYVEVNAWENDLLLLREVILVMADDQIFCGVANAGQERHWQARYHAFAYVQPAASWKRTPRAGIATVGSGRTRQNCFRRYA